MIQNEKFLKLGFGKMVSVTRANLDGEVDGTPSSLTTHKDIVKRAIPIAKPVNLTIAANKR
ncbi:MAG: hypothetical protein QXH10_08370 [Ignisphaera sp.]|uniref:Uncharacterized protein n=1 Tax=Ignisphaera aggregans TaxID=334771 RepID=A0A7C4JJF2_9CREN